jgi:hypothetical protein
MDVIRVRSETLECIYYLKDGALQYINQGNKGSRISCRRPLKSIPPLHSNRLPLHSTIYPTTSLLSSREVLDAYYGSITSSYYSTPPSTVTAGRRHGRNMYINLLLLSLPAFFISKNRSSLTKIAKHILYLLLVNSVAFLLQERRNLRIAEGKQLFIYAIRRS